MVFYEVCNLYEEHYDKRVLIAKLKLSGFTYFGILHNKDYFPTGEAKKPHFHLILGVEGDSRHSKEKVINLFNDSSLLIRNVRNPKGYCRYLTHKDNLEKAQYKDSDIFTNDTLLYEELISVQIKMSSTDNILSKFKEFVTFGDFDFNNPNISSYRYFESLGKVDYFLKNQNRIHTYIDFIIDDLNYEMKKKEEKNGK